MTRFKELARVRKAVADRDDAELQWAADYCASRMKLAPTAAQQRYWKSLLRAIRPDEFPRSPNQEYRCGLHPGDQVRLRKDLAICDHRQKPTGKVHRSGEVWLVLPGSCTINDDVWLKTPDGSPHTWDDDATKIFEWFEKL
jgi:hypothetical protein